MVEALPRCGKFLIFWRWRLIAVKVHRLAKFREGRLNHCRDMTIFEILRWLRFKMCCHSKFHGDPSNTCCVMAVLTVFKMAPICCLRFLKIQTFRPHRSTTYVDAAYCYRPSILVCRLVCLSVTLVSPAKTAAPVEVPFGLRTWVDPRNHVLDGVQIPHGKGQLWGQKRASHCKV